jgi:Na+-driven multidrug efflux pump
MAEDGKAGARLLGSRLTWLSMFGAVLYWAIVIPLHKPLFHFLYSGRYMEVAYLLPALALGQIFWSATFGPSIALRAMESPASVFVALAFATLVSLVVGVPATWAFGLKGAIWGSNLADILSFIALYVVLQRKLTTDDSPERSSWSNWLGKAEKVRTMTLEAPEEI